MNNKKLYIYYFLIFNGSLKYSDKSFQIYNKRKSKIYLGIRIRARGKCSIKTKIFMQKVPRKE